MLALANASKAIKFYQQSISIAREIGDRRGEANALWNSALEFWKLENRSEAIARAEASLHIFEAIEDPNTTTVRTELAQWRAA